MYRIKIPTTSVVGILIFWRINAMVGLFLGD